MTAYELRPRRREDEDDELREAEALVADLLVLVEAGLVAPAEDPAGAVRYALGGPDVDLAAEG